MYLADKFRQYVRIHSVSKEALKKKDKVGAGEAKAIFKDVFGMEIDTSKFKEGWDGGERAQALQGMGRILQSHQISNNDMLFRNAGFGWV